MELDSVVTQLHVDNEVSQSKNRGHNKKHKM